jgi:hypothetical protein
MVWRRERSHQRTALEYVFLLRLGTAHTSRSMFEHTGILFPLTRVFLDVCYLGTYFGICIIVRLHVDSKFF